MPPESHEKAKDKNRMFYCYNGFAELKPYEHHFRKENPFLILWVKYIL